MPQLDISTYSSQLFWLFVTFVGLYLYLSRSVIPKIQKIRDSRWEAIEGKTERMDSLKQRTNDLKEELNVLLVTERGKAHQQLHETHHTTRAELRQKQDAFLQKLSVQLKETEEKLSKQHQQAQSHLQTLQTEMAMEILRKILGAQAPVDQWKSEIEAEISATTLSSQTPSSKKVTTWV